jgi:hypothetical protein
MFRLRAAPSYGPSFGEAFTALESKHLVNALTTESSFVRRVFYVDAQGLTTLRARGESHVEAMGAADTNDCCRRTKGCM